MYKTEGFIPPHGNYRELLSYRKTEIIFYLTFHFCGRFLSRGDRTVDQMVQAARSGKQNIAEGGVASGTSKETEIRLINVARASLEELLQDHHDFLRSRSLSVWNKESREAMYVRDLGARPDQCYDLYRGIVKTRSAEVVANIAICLIHQANYLLDRQLRSLERAFIKDGGMRERMKNVRIRSRRDTSGSGPSPS